MHFTRQIIALRAQSRTLQIFDLDQRAKLKSATMNEDVVFWKWISEDHDRHGDGIGRLPLGRLRRQPAGSCRGVQAQRKPGRKERPQQTASCGLFSKLTGCLFACS